MNTQEGRVYDESELPIVRVRGTLCENIINKSSKTQGLCLEYILGRRRNSGRFFSVKAEIPHVVRGTRMDVLRSFADIQCIAALTLKQTTRVPRPLETRSLKPKKLERQRTGRNKKRRLI